MRIVPFHYIPNGAYGTCQRCGFKYRLSELKREWSNLLVCDPCWDPLPDTFVPPVVTAEGMPLPNASPEAPDVFVAKVTPADL